MGLSIPVEGPWVWLDDSRRVGCVALVCGARVEVVVESIVYEMVASVGDSAAELLMVLLNLGDEVAGEGDVVVVLVVVKAVALKVFSFVIWGLLKKKRTLINVFLLIYTHAPQD